MIAGVTVGGSGAVGEDAGIALAEGETVVQRTTRDSAANINSITENLRITLGFREGIELAYLVLIKYRLKKLPCPYIYPVLSFC